MENPASEISPYGIDFHIMKFNKFNNTSKIRKSLDYMNVITA